MQLFLKKFTVIYYRIQKLLITLDNILETDSSYITTLQLANFREGNEEGFNYFFNTFYSPLCYFANKYTKNYPAAEELVNDVFLRVWAKRRGFISELGLRSYFYKAVYNSALRWLEKQKKYNTDIAKQSMATDENLYIANTIKAETLRELYLVINELPPQCRKIFTKLYIEGKTTKETAAELGLAYSTIKAQNARGLSLIKLKLGHNHSGSLLVLLLLLQDYSN